MDYYGEEHPRHGHRSPSDLAEEEILAALPRGSRGREPTLTFVRFKARESPENPLDGLKERDREKL
jgi:hypothetical protein